MEREQAIVELEILRAEELRAYNGKESPLTEAVAIAIHALHSPAQPQNLGEGINVSQYAARKRVSETAVRKAITTGRLYGSAIARHERGYIIFPTIADPQWDAFRLAPNGQRQSQQYWPRKKPTPTADIESIFGDPAKQKLKSDLNTLAAYWKNQPTSSPPACTCDFCSNVDFNQVAKWPDAVLNEYHRLHDFAGKRLNRRLRPELKPKTTASLVRLSTDQSTPTLPANVLRFPLTDVITLTGLSRSSLYQRIADGRLCVTKDGRRVFIARSELQRYLAACEGVVP